jgi:hypothetical protein
MSDESFQKMQLETKARTFLKDLHKVKKIQKVTLKMNPLQKLRGKKGILSLITFIRAKLEELIIGSN